MKSTVATTVFSASFPREREAILNFVEEAQMDFRLRGNDALVSCGT
jgi:hypothetical protein